MALDFETLKKIEAGGVNVGMIQNSAGDILWRKKYKECSLGLGTIYDTTEPYAWRPYFSSTFNALLNNAYFHYGDRVDLFQSLDGTKNTVVSWYGDRNANNPEQYVSFLKTAAVSDTAKTTVVAAVSRHIAAAGLLKEYGKIENQTRISNYSGYATDDKACLVARTETSDTATTPNATAWGTLMPQFGATATFCNRYYNFGAISASTTSANQLTVNMVSTGVSGGKEWFKATITAKCTTLPAVAFSWKSSDGSKGVITLKNGESTTFTFNSDSTSTINIYQPSCYINSSGSIVGTTSSSAFTISKSSMSYIGSTVYIPLTAVYPAKGSTNYGFLLDASGNITNSNQKVASSFCYCTMAFQRPDKRFTKLRITYTQSSEVNYDYGQFSKIDKMLCAYYVGDNSSTGFGTDVVQHSCKGENSTERVVTYDISSLTPGTDHIINFKYHKDSSGDTGTDTFKISKIEFLENCEYSFAYDNIKQTYGLTVQNTGSTAVTFNWYWFYIEGSEEDYISSDIGDLSATIPAANTVTMWLTDAAIPEQSGMIAGMFSCNGAFHLFVQ